MIDELIGEVLIFRDEKYASWAKDLLQIKEDGYGENDKLLGVRIPDLRKIAKKYIDLPLDETEQLLQSEYHDMRMLALFILINKYKKYPDKKDKIMKIYMNNLHYVNNWDLVDISAPNLLGQYVFEKQPRLYMIMILSESNKLWEERIAIVSTLYFIKHGIYSPTLEIADKYVSHNHHLIHKATGWMLRELGKYDVNELYKFLDKNVNSMPRVMLRYSIERLPDDKRKYYLNL